MARKPTGRPPGAPLKRIDWDWVDKQLMAGCHGTEIAAALKIHPDTFYRRVEIEKKMGFTEYSREKSADGDRLLRGFQFQSAAKGNVTMLIWLGKQRLGQKDDPSNHNQKTNQLVQHLLDQIMQMKQERVADPQKNEILMKTSSIDKPIESYES